MLEKQMLKNFHKSKSDVTWRTVTYMTKTCVKNLRAIVYLIPHQMLEIVTNILNQSKSNGHPNTRFRFR